MEGRHIPFSRLKVDTSLRKKQAGGRCGLSEQQPTATQFGLRAMPKRMGANRGQVVRWPLVSVPVYLGVISGIELEVKEGKREKGRGRQSGAG